MATSIVSENSDIVLLSCHQGLSAEEITHDCLEKAKALTLVGLGYLAGMPSPLPTSYISVLDDWLELGLKHCRLIGLSPEQRKEALVKKKIYPVG